MCHVHRWPINCKRQPRSAAARRTREASRCSTCARVKPLSPKLRPGPVGPPAHCDAAAPSAALALEAISCVRVRFRAPPSTDASLAIATATEARRRAGIPRAVQRTRCGARLSLRG
eukprot:350951-Chlamydomonas_euryale.AAC.10